MRSQSVSMYKLLKNKRRFSIPEVQRDYTWSKKGVLTLLNDLSSYTNEVDHTVTPYYFVGSLILYEIETEPDVYQIMDGQQRITTFTTLYAALRARLQRLIISGLLSAEDKSFAQTMIENIDSKVLWHTFDPDVMKMEPKDVETRKFLQAILDFKNKDPGTFSKDFTSVSAKNLSIAFGAFWDQISTWDLQQIKTFLKCLNERVMVSVTFTEDISVAFQMFVSVNQGGTDLNDYDLFRGLVFTKAHILGVSKPLKPKMAELSKTIRECMGTKEGQEAERLTNNIMRKWTSTRYGLPVKDKQVASKLDAEIRELKTLEELEEIVSQAYAFCAAYSELHNAPEAIRFAEQNNGEWQAGRLQSRRVSAFASGGFISLQHSAVLIAMYARKHLNKSGYSDRDINQVMDYIEWLEFRLAGDSGSSRRLYTVYAKIANRAINASSVATWWSELTNEGNTLHSKSMVNGFGHLRDRPIDHFAAIAYLSKVRNSTKDPGRRTRNYSCKAITLVPIGSPKPWRLQNDENDRISQTIGNWFLVSGQQKDLDEITHAPSSRLKAIFGKAETNDTRQELIAIENNCLPKGQKEVERYWSKREIGNRTGRIIRELEAAYPRTFKKK